MSERRLTAQQAADLVKREDHVTLFFPDSFEEFSATNKEFREEIYAPEHWHALAPWGGEFKYETHLQDPSWSMANDFERGAIDRIILACDWSYIILHDQVHPQPGHMVLIWNSEKPQDEELIA